MSVVIETTIGDITVDLYLKERPNACLNFLKLCRIKYYNLCIFYKVEQNFIAQTGDPTATGRGGESIFSHLYGEQAKYFDCELKPRLKHEKLGTLSMVNNGNNMNGSQFFLTLGENLTYLDEVHTVFGEVVEGFDVLIKINEAICDPSSRPYQDIRITHTVVLHDPYDDPAGLQIPDASPVPTKEQLDSGYIGADEEIDDTKGKNAQEIEEKIKDSEAKARATILEMVGDLPDADVKPPENVLFVCKLNPVTTSEDLEIIFSRFGKIESCEVIKDRKTGESLQYAFIEFEREEDCENAYFKMDNVLIDDRRIHVDFSQSVSKMNWEKEANSKLKNLSKRQNFVIKGAQKKSDGYDMVFDMDTAAPKKDFREHKDHYKDSRDKKQALSSYDSNKRSKSNTYDFNKRSRYSPERRYKDRYNERDSRYSSRKSDYDSSSVRSKNDKYRDTDTRHRISRSPNKKVSQRRSHQKSGSSDQLDRKSSSSTVKKHAHRHDSLSDRSVSPTLKKSVHDSSYKKDTLSQRKEEYSKSKTFNHKNSGKVSPPMHQKKKRRQDSSSSSSSTSRSSESPSPVRKSLKKTEHRRTMRSRSPESIKYKKKSTKNYSQSPDPYHSKKSITHKSTGFHSRSSSPEMPRKMSSKQKSSKRRPSSSPELVQSSRRQEYSKLKHTESRGVYEKDPKHTKSSKSSKNYSKFSDDSSESNAKQYKSKMAKPSPEHQHISRKGKSHKKHKHSRRSSS